MSSLEDRREKVACVERNQCFDDSMVDANKGGYMRMRDHDSDCID